MYICMYVCMFVCMYVCTYPSIHSSVCLPTNTSTFLPFLNFFVCFESGRLTYYFSICPGHNLNTFTRIIIYSSTCPSDS